MSRQDDQASGRAEAQKTEVVSDSWWTVDRAHRVFNLAIGASIPVVLTISIGFIDRIAELEQYRALDEYRVDELLVWRSQGEYERLVEEHHRLAERVAELREFASRCQYRVEALERAAGVRRPHEVGGGQP